MYKIIILLFSTFFLFNMPVEAETLYDQKKKYEMALTEAREQKEAAETKKEKINLSRSESTAAAYVRAYQKAIEYINEQEPEPFYLSSTSNDFDMNLDHDLQYIEIYKAAAEAYKIDWALLAAVHDQETNFSKHPTMISSAGALGHMQFMPGTWDYYGVDANNNGKRDPFEIEDAIYSAANYLSATGASEGDIKGALWAYNHSTSYGVEVMQKQAYYAEKNE